MKQIYLFLLFSLLISCKKEGKLPPIDNNVDLDGTLIQDSSLIEPEKFLLSAALPSPTAGDLKKKIVIAVHGFSATNFEWQEFASWVKAKPDVLVSRVLLGGHGRDYANFRNASWTDWQAPIIEEYSKLKNLGYQNISFAGSSTGCPLILQALKDKKITGTELNKVFFIDPIVVPSNKMLPLVTVLGGTIIDYSETTIESGENGYWYKYRPQEALRELHKITKQSRKLLEKGFDPGVTIKVFKSEHDDAADPLSAVLLERGLKNCEVKMVDSRIHVFTRLKGRNSFTEKDKTTQLEIFEEIYKSL